MTQRPWSGSYRQDLQTAACQLQRGNQTTVSHPPKDAPHRCQQHPKPKAPVAVEPISVSRRRLTTGLHQLYLSSNNNINCWHVQALRYFSKIINNKCNQLIATFLFVCRCVVSPQKIEKGAVIWVRPNNNYNNYNNEFWTMNMRDRTDWENVMVMVAMIIHWLIISIGVTMRLVFKEKMQNVF